MQMADMAALPCRTVGNSKRVTGRKSTASFSVRRQRRAISISPLHRHSIPVREIASVTASPQPEIAAEESSSILPVKAAVTSEKMSRTVRITFITGKAPFSSGMQAEMYHFSKVEDVSTLFALVPDEYGVNHRIMEICTMRKNHRFL